MVGGTVQLGVWLAGWLTADGGVRILCGVPRVCAPELLRVCVVASTLLSLLCGAVVGFLMM